LQVSNLFRNLYRPKENCRAVLSISEPGRTTTHESHVPIQDT